MEYINLTRLALLLETRANQKSMVEKALDQSVATSASEYLPKTEAEIDEVLKPLPHGSGIDNGMTLDLEKSTPKKIIFRFGFHHMDSNGYYCGWTNHDLIITPTFGGFNLRITGPNKNNVKDHLYQLFDVVFCVLNQEDTLKERETYYDFLEQRRAKMLEILKNNPIS